MLGAAGSRARPKRSRLSRSGDFERVFRNGRSHAGRELVLYVFPREQAGSQRLGLSVSRRVGGSVQRNRVKRLLREAFRLARAELPPGLDLVIVPRGPALTFAQASTSLPELARAIARRIGPGASKAAAP